MSGFMSVQSSLINEIELAHKLSNVSMVTMKLPFNENPLRRPTIVIICKQVLNSCRKLKIMSHVTWFVDGA